MQTDFVLNALQRAVYARLDPNELVHHSGRCSQYLSIRYSERLTEVGIEPSVGSKGGSSWKTVEAVEMARLEWVARFNHQRLLEPIGYIPSAEAEANHYAARKTETASNLSLLELNQTASAIPGAGHCRDRSSRLELGLRDFYI